MKRNPKKKKEKEKKKTRTVYTEMEFQNMLVVISLQKKHIYRVYVEKEKLCVMLNEFLVQYLHGK